MALEWRTIRKELLEPSFLLDVTELLSGSEFTWYVTQGFRDSVAQNKLYGQGRTVEELSPYGLAAYARPDLPKVTKARAGLSAHSYGLAIDVAFDADKDKAGLQLDWNPDHPAWQWLVAAVKKHPRLKSGVSWNDTPHIERFRWQLYSNWRLKQVLV